MKPHRFLTICILAILLTLLLPIHSEFEAYAQSIVPERSPYSHPFSKFSPWNMPIGSNAVYVDAGIDVQADISDAMLYSDEDFVLLNPNDPVVNLRRHTTEYNSPTSFWSAGHNKWVDRCQGAGNEILSRVHVPEQLVSTGSGNTPNASAGILVENSFNILETQPFARCTVGGEAYSQWPSSSSWIEEGYLDIRGSGIGRGGHGGSGLAASAGTILPRDFQQGIPQDSIKHALKFVLPESLLYQSGSTVFESYRWPAQRGDCCTNYDGEIPDFTMGSLLALDPSFDTLSLESEFGRRIAWTLQNYGGYVVDTAGWDATVLQLGTTGSNDVQAEFEAVWGHPFAGNPGDSDFHNDYETILEALQVVANNSPTSIGGGGNPRQCLAGNFGNNITDLIATNPNGNVVEPSFCFQNLPSTPNQSQPTNTPTNQPPVTNNVTQNQNQPTVSTPTSNVINRTQNLVRSGGFEIKVISVIISFMFALLTAIEYIQSKNNSIDKYTSENLRDY